MKLPLFFALLAQVSFSAQVVPNRFEVVAADERTQIQNLIAGIKKGLKKTRDAHAKNHGCTEAEVTVAVDPTLNEATKAKLQTGFFSQAGKKYDAVVRFSPGSGNPQVSDHDGGGQGFALKMLLDNEDQKKLVPVFHENEHFVEEKFYKTFDILTISHSREFMVETISDYPSFFAASGMAAQSAKAAFEEAIKSGKSPEEAGKAAKAAAGKAMFENYIAPAGGKQRPREGALLAKLGAAHPKNLLIESYGSWVPSLLGKEAIKYEITPCEPKDPSTYEVPAEVGEWKKDPNFMAKVLSHELSKQPHCFDLKVQLHQEGFPSVEDSVAVWPTEKSPYVKVAQILIPQKKAGSALLDNDFCEALSFHPGHASAEHYPIGGIQRARVGSVDEQGPIEGIYTVIHRQRNLNADRKPR